MTTILLGAAVGVFVLVMRIYDGKKDQKELDKELEKNKFECYDFSKGVTIALLLLTIPSAVSIYFGYVAQDETTIALGVMLVFLFVSEAYAAKQYRKIYYNDTGIIIQNKYVRYKSIKSVVKDSPLPGKFAKFKLHNFSNEQWKVFYQAVRIIKEKAPNTNIIGFEEKKK